MIVCLPRLRRGQRSHQHGALFTRHEASDDKSFGVALTFYLLLGKPQVNRAPVEDVLDFVQTALDWLF